MPTKKKSGKPLSKKKSQPAKQKAADRTLPDWLPAPVAVRMQEIMAGDQGAADSDERDRRFIALVTDARMEQVWKDIGNELERRYCGSVTGDQLNEWVADGQYSILYHATNTDSRLTWRQTVPHPRQWQDDIKKIQHHITELHKLLDDYVTGTYTSVDEAWKVMLAPRPFTPWDVFDPVAWELLSKGDPEYISLLKRYVKTRFGPYEGSTYASIYLSSPDARTTLNTLDVELQLLHKLATHADLPSSWHMRKSNSFYQRVYVRERYQHFKSMGLSPRSNSADARDGFSLYSIIAKISNVALALNDDALTGEDVRKMIPTLEQ